MLSLQEIKPRQIRALLLLLIVAPLIPTGLLLRFMFDTVQQEREAARETIASAWQDTLSIAVRTLGKSLKPELTAAPNQVAAARLVAAALQNSFEHQVQVRVLGNTLLAGPAVVSGSPVAAAEIPGLLPGARVELYLADRSFVQNAVREQIDTYTQTVVITIAANLLIALVAGWAFLRQVRNQELKSSALATLAHELRTPIASMRLLLDTIREGRCPDPPEYLELLHSENLRLSRLVDQFLTHSRLELGHTAFSPAPVSVETLVVEVEEGFSTRLRAPVEYRHEMEKNLPPVLGDAAALGCLLANLLDNALKYTGANKEILLEVRKSSGGIEFSVRDNGIGMAADDQKSIFERFHQIDNRLARNAEGCGLGLSIVRRIVEMHRGRIRVESAPGEGSCFFIWLPASAMLEI